MFFGGKVLDLANNEEARGASAHTENVLQLQQLRALRVPQHGCAYCVCAKAALGRLSMRQSFRKKMCAHLQLLRILSVGISYFCAFQVCAKAAAAHAW